MLKASKKFIIVIIVLALLGVFLRLVDYSKIPPFDVTKDEFFYPWSGMTFLQTGVPKAWSLFDAYPTGEIVYKWGTWYRIVSPWVEKPPLYSLLAGFWMLGNGVTDMFEVRLSLLRILPITISFFTILFLALFANKLFGKTVAVISTVIYATVPTIVMGNRLSLVENLLTPIVLAGLYLFLILKGERMLNYLILSTFCALALLTKNIGAALPATFFIYYLSKRKWKALMIISSISALAFLFHPIIATVYYGFGQFLNVMGAYQKVHALAGPPELVSTIFRFPIVGHQWDKIFPDGPMLLGYILLFSAPMWLKRDEENLKKIISLIGFPFVYIISLGLLESAGTPYSFFGWHVYPIYPFLAILIGKLFVDVWEDPKIEKLALIYLTVGFSTVRFLTLIFPSTHKSWQEILSIVLLALLSLSFLRKSVVRNILVVSFFIFIAINCILIFNLNFIYPSFEQPLN